MKKEFKQMKSFVGGDESKALAKAVKSLGVPAEQLETAHEEKKFVFKIKEVSEASKETDPKYPFGTFAVEKTTDENDLKNAVTKAKEHFKTFDGNLKRVPEKEDETHYVFTKVRG